MLLMLLRSSLGVYAKLVSDKLLAWTFGLISYSCPGEQTLNYMIHIWKLNSFTRKKTPQIVAKRNLLNFLSCACSARCKQIHIQQSLNAVSSGHVPVLHSLLSSRLLLFLFKQSGKQNLFWCRLSYYNQKAGKAWLALLWAAWAPQCETSTNDTNFPPQVG